MARADPAALLAGQIALDNGTTNDQQLADHASDTQQKESAETVTVEDWASLPLLQPFQIKKPSESHIINTLIHEQHAAKLLELKIDEEQKLRGELKKAQNETDDKDKSKDKSKKERKKAKKNSGPSAKERELESRILECQSASAQLRQNLCHFAGLTRTMIQAEYTKIAVTLDNESDRYAELEEAFAFLCPVLDDEPYHDQRLAYVR